MIGLLGPQRCGKSTLAKTYAEAHGIPFVETSASTVFKDMGLNPAKTYDFGTRMAVQEAILGRFNEQYFHAPSQAITDRTPLDLMAYTLSECLNETVPPNLEDQLDRYIHRCFESLNNYFSIVMLIQPGIALVAQEGKAGISRGHIEHMNALMFGLMVDPRNRVPSYFMRRQYVSMTERMQALEDTTLRATNLHRNAVNIYVESGRKLQ